MSRLMVALLLVLGFPGEARALTCTAAMSDITFGTVSLRSGVNNATSGTLQIDCTGAVLAVVGVCVEFGAGSGGAAAGLSPRYMRRGDGARLNYELRATGNGAAHSTWTRVFLTLPVVLGRASTAIPVYADITSSGVATGTGAYFSLFSGPAAASVRYGVTSCAESGATTAPPPFTVTAEVASSCEIDAAALDFGSVPFQIAQPIDRSTTLTVRCTATTTYAIRLGFGESPGVTDARYRKMRSALGEILYGLYRDAARSAPWGDSPTNDIDAQGVGSDQSFTVYGRIHGGQSVAAGVYTDAVVVTIEY